jgi:3-oxoacyl-[acyl-carrier protein] reductase
MSRRMLDGRPALVTGGADGLGWALAQAFAGEGAPVIIADVRAEAARDRALSLRNQGFAAVAVECDVTDETHVDNAARLAVTEFGSLGVWVNNAGFTRDAVLRRLTVEDFRAVIEVHLLGSWLGLRSAVAVMRECGNRGSIINVSSISGKVGNPGQTAYSAAKAGIIGLTKAAAKEVARYGIRVNAIQPGLIDTEMTRRMDQGALARGLDQVPVGRIGRPDEVANVAVFLASELSSYMTGAVLEIAGGRHM